MWNQQFQLPALEIICLHWLPAFVEALLHFQNGFPKYMKYLGKKKKKKN